MRSGFSVHPSARPKKMVEATDEHPAIFRTAEGRLVAGKKYEDWESKQQRLEEEMAAGRLGQETPAGLLGAWTQEAAACAQEEAARVYHRVYQASHSSTEKQQAWPTHEYEALEHPGWIRVGFANPDAYMSGSGDGTHYLASSGSIVPFEWRKSIGCLFLDSRHRDNPEEEPRRYILRRAREWRLVETGQRRNAKQGDWYRDNLGSFFPWNKDVESIHEFDIWRGEEVKG